jgi:hypothetical protein
MALYGSSAMQGLRDVGVVALILMALPLLIAFLVGWLLWMWLWGLFLWVWFWRAHASKGRRVLFVYSNSPNWQEYVERELLPDLRPHAVVLNWSERRDWADLHPWEKRFFERFSPEREFNPAAYVFQSWGRVRCVRFFEAFRDLKHGKAQPLSRAEEELRRLLSAAV